MNPISESIETIMSKDPAARTRLEVVLCYPGFHAVTVHLLSHALWQRQLTTLARVLSHLARVYTGIEIHPGATIGRRVFIDHGMGVVIGETAVIGDDVVIYQGVTLGAGAAARMGAKSRGQKRHPTLCNGVVVGSNAEVQGDIVLGENVRVASGSIVLKDVPADSVVVGVPGRVISQNGHRVPNESIDIEAEAIRGLKDSINRLQTQLVELNDKLMMYTGTPSVPSIQSLQDEHDGDDPSKDPVEIFLHGAGI
jgi:serine O-acetyltransferase